jgi:hypothetical protein
MWITPFLGYDTASLLQHKNQKITPRCCGVTHNQTQCLLFTALHVILFVCTNTQTLLQRYICATIKIYGQVHVYYRFMVVHFTFPAKRLIHVLKHTKQTATGKLIFTEVLPSEKKTRPCRYIQSFVCSYVNILFFTLTFPGRKSFQHPALRV